MSRPTSLLRNAARLALLLPFAIPAAGCGDDVQSDGTTGDAGKGSETSAGGGGEGGGTDGGNGMDGATGNDGAVTPDTTHPTVTGTVPANAATGVGANTIISADFSKPMAPGSLTGAGVNTFTVTTLAVPPVDVPGTVSYFDNTATFAPTNLLDQSATYRATISTAATDVAGNALAVQYSWTFMTDSTAPRGPRPVLLGGAGRFVILAASAITDVPTSLVTGDVALSPAAASFITGFTKTKAGTFWTAPEVVGKLYAADNDAPTPSNLTTAINDMITAYTDAGGRTTDYLNLDSGNLGTTPTIGNPGVYTFGTGVTVNDVTIDGGPNDVYIFQISGDLAMPASKNITLTGGLSPKNVFWEMTGHVTIGATAKFKGIVLCKTDITLDTGASINGRLLSQTAVTIRSSTVTKP